MDISPAVGITKRVPPIANHSASSEESYAGIALAAGALVVLPLLGTIKKRTGSRLGAPVLVTEARVTIISASLAASLLTGLLLNTALGWWWADALAALGLATMATKEGQAAMQGD